MKILVTGAGGMLGRAVVLHCRAAADEVFAHDHRSLDITEAASINAVFERERPAAVINCAAWTDVDGCEQDPERARAANARGPELLAVACRQSGAQLITISTDYVFDGAKQGFYTQRDDPQPISVYGKAKLEGERLAQAACARTSIVRSGWIFGPGGRNYLSRVIELAQGGQTLKAIGDAYGTPTYAVHLAARLRELVALDLPGIYHIVNDGAGASFEEFTRAALAAAGDLTTKVESVAMDSLRRPAPRPRNSRLRCLLSEALNLQPLPDWRAALAEFAANSSTAPREQGLTEGQA
ncbi:MAG: dTDP-4-dehydrorhamnose reductase [Blastocatellia bacterium]|jgi:dTDP-4-dehydrorhamnose reductase|nr:dTDP-4-dehydrorhamnose reductase [Blastocatellia bacterium]